MSLNSKKTILLIIFLIASLFSYSIGKSGRIERLFEKAKVQYQMGYVSESLETLEKLLELDGSFCNALLLRADIVHDLKLNEEEISTLISIKEKCDASKELLSQRLGNAYFATGKYELALENYISALSGTFDDAKINSIRFKINCCRFGLTQIGKNNDIPLDYLDTIINTEKEEYWPAISHDGEMLYFNRLERDRFGVMSEDFFASRLSNGVPDSAFRLSEPINSIENEGAMSITADGKMIFFTACSRKDGKGKCDIYVTIKREGVWLKPINLKGAVNTEMWETQPSVSADGTILYFVSNRPGGMGKKDIWQAQRVGFDLQGFPIYDHVNNLGENINTAQDDYSPFIHADDVTLYFASTGHIGMGGADLFFSRLTSNGFSIPQNLGHPINSYYNDDGLVVSAVSTESFFVSNRVFRGRSDKNIIKFDMPEWMLPFPMSYVKGNVYDAETKKRIKAQVVVVDLESGKVQNFNVDPFDGYIACLKQDRIYAMEVISQGYMMHSTHFDLANEGAIRDAMIMDVSLQPLTIGETITLNNIFYEFDSFQLNEKSMVELNHVVAFLKENPNVIIEIGGHTDSLGSKAYNKQLSVKRANQVYIYLSQYIASDRLRFKGYGDEIPLKDNSTETGRKANRRTELKIHDVQVVEKNEN